MIYLQGFMLKEYSLNDISNIMDGDYDYANWLTLSVEGVIKECST